ncbi:hypothetical protein ACHAXR_001542 [Thalassiosira sp. AJA248-18]
MRRYTFEPKKSHEAATKRIGRYLKGTMDKGITLDPNDDLTVDCYPAADFAGLWGHQYQYPHDPHCARSRTGYVITLEGCPVVWILSKSLDNSLISQSKIKLDSMFIFTKNGHNLSLVE